MDHDPMVDPEKLSCGHWDYLERATIIDGDDYCHLCAPGRARAYAEAEMRDEAA